jgi:hypothetical protein
VEIPNFRRETTPNITDSRFPEDSGSVETYTSLVRFLGTVSSPRLTIQLYKDDFSHTSLIRRSFPPHINHTQYLLKRPPFEALMPHSTYPRVSSADYHLSQDILCYQDIFDNACFLDTYTSSPDYFPVTLSENDGRWDPSFTSLDMMPSNFSAKDQTFNSMMFQATGTPAIDNRPGFEHKFPQESFGQLEQYDTSYTIDPSSVIAAEPTAFSPMTEASSRTPSLCSDAQQQAHSPSVSPRLVKLESPFSSASIEEQTTSKRVLRKRGRPRLDRSDTEILSPISSSSKNQRTGRLPHNQVERKYREGLNSGLERLRRAVPTLPHNEDGGVMGQPKPSKAMVLSSAIDYIRSIEKERDALRIEVERLKQGQGQYMGYARDSNPLDEFLIDA